MKAAGRRRSTRMPTSIQGSLSGRSPHGITVRDLSASGCLVHCDALLDAGSIHDLSLSLGSEEFAAKVRVTEASVDGTVEGDARYLVGLEFLGLPVQAAAQLRRFLEDEGRRRRAARVP